MNMYQLSKGRDKHDAIDLKVSSSKNETLNM